MHDTSIIAYVGFIHRFTLWPIALLSLKFKLRPKRRRNSSFLFVKHGVQPTYTNCSNLARLTVRYDFLYFFQKKITIFTSRLGLNALASIRTHSAIPILEQ